MARSSSMRAAIRSSRSRSLQSPRKVTTAPASSSMSRFPAGPCGCCPDRYSSPRSPCMAAAMAVIAQWFDCTPPVVRTTVACWDSAWPSRAASLRILLPPAAIPFGEQVRAVAERGHQAGQPVQRRWADAKRDTGERRLRAMGPGAVFRARMRAHGVVHLLTCRMWAGTTALAPSRPARGRRGAVPLPGSACAARRPTAARLRVTMCRTATAAMATTMATGAGPTRGGDHGTGRRAPRHRPGPSSRLSTRRPDRSGNSPSTGSSNRSQHSSTIIIAAAAVAGLVIDVIRNKASCRTSR